MNTPGAGFPIATGIRNGSRIAIPKFVARNALTAKSTRPPSRFTITAAAVAVGVIPVKNAACASSFPPSERSSTQLPIPTATFAPRIFKCATRTSRHETFTCRNTRNIITTMSQRISQLNAEAHGHA